MIVLVRCSPLVVVPCQKSLATIVLLPAKEVEREENFDFSCIRRQRQQLLIPLHAALISRRQTACVEGG